MKLYMITTERVEHCMLVNNYMYWEAPNKTECRKELKKLGFNVVNIDFVCDGGYEALDEMRRKK